MLRIKLEVSYFDIVSYWIGNIRPEDINTIILILDFNIKATRRRNCNLHYLLYFWNQLHVSYNFYTIRIGTSFSNRICWFVITILVKILKFKVLWHFDWVLSISVCRPPISFSFHSVIVKIVKIDTTNSQTHKVQLVKNIPCCTIRPV